MKILAIDTEFRNQQNPVQDHICASVKTDSITQSWWFFNNPIREKLIASLEEFLDEHKDHLFISHTCLAEARFLLDLGIDPTQYNWYDTSIEFMMLLNYSDHLYRPHIFYSRKTGVATVRKVLPLHEFKALDDTRYYTIEHPRPSLIAALFAMLGLQDHKGVGEHKALMTNLILSGCKKFSPSQQQDIIKYCESDTVHLPELYQTLRKEIELRLNPTDRSKYLKQAIARANYQVSLAKMYQHGYPKNTELLEAITNNESTILFDVKKNINRLFPEICPFDLLKSGRFVKKYDRIESYIRKKNLFNDWPKTPSNKVKLDDKTLGEYAVSDEKYGPLPDDDFFGHLKRFARTEQTLRGFKRYSDNTIYDSIGTDGRIRPFVPSFGGATGRTQYLSRNLLFLKAKWARQLVSDPNKVLISCDYKSCEFLISGLLSNDREMINAYKSGDVYVYFGGKYGIDRPTAKAVVLGITYGLTKFGLSKQLKCSEQEAQKYISSFFELFHVFKTYMDDIKVNEYKNNDYVQTNSGWTMFNKNFNFRSHFNFRIQAACGDMLRVAMSKCLEFKIMPLFSLHDAIYIEADLNSWQEDARCLQIAMRHGFGGYFDHSDDSGEIGLDVEAWHHSLEHEKIDYNFETRPAYLTEFDLDGNKNKIYQEYKNILGKIDPTLNEINI